LRPLAGNRDGLRQRPGLYRLAMITRMPAPRRHPVLHGLSPQLIAGGRDMAGSKPKRRRRRISKRVAPYLFLAPFALLFLAFLIAPMIYAFNLAIYRT